MIVKLFNVVLLMSNIISGDGYPITRNSFLNGISKYANSMINMVNDDDLQPDYLLKKTKITTDFKLDTEEDTEAQSELKIVKDEKHMGKSILFFVIVEKIHKKINTFGVPKKKHFFGGAISVEILM